MKVFYIVLFVTAALFASAIARPKSKANNHERRVRSLPYRTNYQKPRYNPGYDSYLQDQDVQDSEYFPRVPQVPQFPQVPQEQKFDGYFSGHDRQLNTNEVDRHYIPPQKNNHEDFIQKDNDADVEYDDSDEDFDVDDYLGQNWDGDEEDDDDDDFPGQKWNGEEDDDDHDDDDEDVGEYQSQDQGRDQDQNQGQDQDQDRDQDQGQQNEINRQSVDQQYQDVDNDFGRQEAEINDLQKPSDFRGSINPRIGRGSFSSELNNFDDSWLQKPGPQQERFDESHSAYNDHLPSHVCSSICDAASSNLKNIHEFKSLCDCTNYANPPVMK